MLVSEIFLIFKQLTVALLTLPLTPAVWPWSVQKTTYSKAIRFGAYSDVVSRFMVNVSVWRKILEWTAVSPIKLPYGVYLWLYISPLPNIERARKLDGKLSRYTTSNVTVQRSPDFLLCSHNYQGCNRTSSLEHKHKVCHFGGLADICLCLF